jgi:hypothetical protein
MDDRLERATIRGRKRSIAIAFSICRCRSPAYTHGRADRFTLGQKVSVRLTKGHVHDGAILGHVDCFAGEKIGSCLFQSIFLGMEQEGVQISLAEKGAGEIEMQTASLKVQAFVTRQIEQKG